MKKILLVCVLSLLSITGAFGGFKATKEAFKKDFKEFVDKKKPKVEAVLKKGEESLQKVNEKAKKFLEEEWPKIEAALKNSYKTTKEGVANVYDDSVEELVEEFLAKEGFKKDIEEFVEFMMPKVEAALENAFDEIGEYGEGLLKKDGPRIKAALKDIEEAMWRSYKKTKEGVTRAYDEVKEYVEDEVCSVDKKCGQRIDEENEKIEELVEPLLNKDGPSVTVLRAGIPYVYGEVYESEEEYCGKMIDEESQKRDLLDLVKSDFLKARTCFELKGLDVVANAALDNGLRHLLRHEHFFLSKLADSLDEVRKHMINFIDKHGSMIEQLEETDNIRVALKMELSDFEGIELAGELVDYRIFVAACKYLISLEEVSLAYSDEELAISVKNFRHRLEVFERALRCSFKVEM